MHVGVCWYQKGTNNKWTYDLTDHLMVEQETMIALASMTCVVDLDAYGLHLGDKQVFNNFINECQGFRLYILQGFISIQEYIYVLMLMTIQECKFLHKHIVTCIYIIEIVHVSIDFFFKELVYRGVQGKL